MFIQGITIGYYETVHDLQFKIVDVPTVSSNSPTYLNLNEDITRFDLTGVFVDGDQMAFSWRGVNYSDCNPINFLGSYYTYNHTHWPSIWFGFDSGVHGIVDKDYDELHMCWKSTALNAPDAWIRVKKTTGKPYTVRIFQYETYDGATVLYENSECPELESFDPEYGSAMLTDEDTVIKFNFKLQAVYPSK